MRVLVTGGAGFIGSHVVEAYLHRGDEVVVIDNLSHGNRQNIPEDAELVELDIRDPRAGELIRKRGFDLVNHHAAQIDVRRSVLDPAFDADVNLNGLLNILQACCGASVGRVVYISSGGVVYGEPDLRPTPESSPKLPESPYGVTKLAGEHYLYYYNRVHGLDYAVLRYANVYGPRQDPYGEAGVVAIFATRALQRQPLTIFGDGEQTRDYLYVADAAAANLVLSDASFAAPRSLDDRAFNVGTGHETSVNSLAKTLLHTVQRAPDLHYARPRAGEVRHSSLDASRLRALGWLPETDLETGLRATSEWLRSANAAASALSGIQSAHAVR